MICHIQYDARWNRNIIKVSKNIHKVSRFLKVVQDLLRSISFAYYFYHLNTKFIYRTGHQNPFKSVQ